MVEKIERINPHMEKRARDKTIHLQHRGIYVTTPHVCPDKHTPLPPTSRTVTIFQI